MILKILRIMKTSRAFLLLFFTMLAFVASAEAARQFVYFGTRTPPAKGIYVARFDSSTGELSVPVIAGEVANATFIARHPTLPVIYAAGSGVGKDGQLVGGVVAAFRVNSETGALALINQVEDGTDNGTYISVSPDGHTVLTAHYFGGYISSFPVNADGSLGACASRIKHTLTGKLEQQSSPHPHWIAVAPGGDGKTVLVTDLAADRIFGYELGENSALTGGKVVAALTTGSGTRHIAFGKGGGHLYAINEIASTIVAFDYDAKAAILHEIQTISTMPDNFTGRRWACGIAMHPNGKWLYASNRPDDNSLVVFDVDAASGKLTLAQRVGGLSHPRHFAISPDGNWLICGNQDSNSAESFRIDQTTGTLSAPVSRVSVPTCVCVLFWPAGK